MQVLRGLYQVGGEFAGHLLVALQLVLQLHPRVLTPAQQAQERRQIIEDAFRSTAAGQCGSDSFARFTEEVDAQVQRAIHAMRQAASLLDAGDLPPEGCTGTRLEWPLQAPQRSA